MISHLLMLKYFILFKLCQVSKRIFSVSQVSIFHYTSSSYQILESTFHFFSWKFQWPPLYVRFYLLYYRQLEYWNIKHDPCNMAGRTPTRLHRSYVSMFKFSPRTAEFCKVNISQNWAFWPFWMVMYCWKFFWSSDTWKTFQFVLVNVWSKPHHFSSLIQL